MTDTRPQDLIAHIKQAALDAAFSETPATSHRQPHRVEFILCGRRAMLHLTLRTAHHTKLFP